MYFRMDEKKECILGWMKIIRIYFKMDELKKYCTLKWIRINKMYFRMDKNKKKQ